MAFSWDDASKYSEVLDQYLPNVGEGDTIATQASTAVSRIGYRWFNDGDTIWTDECQSCADWLYENIDGVKPVIDSLNEYMFACMPSINRKLYDLYGDKLKEIIDAVADENLLKELNDRPLAGSIYNCEGPVLTAMEKCQAFEDDVVS